MVRLVCISDTHLREPYLPDGDILVHAGDFCAAGTVPEFAQQVAWLKRQPHRYKVVVAGNHDWPLQDQSYLAEEMLKEVPGLTYLRNTAATVGGLSFWGSPYTPQFLKWAFMRPRGRALAAMWEYIPQGIDVLVTHGPPYGVLDRTHREGCQGCQSLRLALNRVQPRLHIFGHIHEAAGETTLEWDDRACHSINAAMPYGPVTVDLEPRTASA